LILNWVVVIGTVLFSLGVVGLFWSIIFGNPFIKKKPNPEIEIFETAIKHNKMSIFKGSFWRNVIRIYDKDEFITYAKRNNVKTIFKCTYVYNNIDYFYNVEGKVVVTSLRKEVKR